MGCDEGVYELYVGVYVESCYEAVKHMLFFRIYHSECMSVKAIRRTLLCSLTRMVSNTYCSFACRSSSCRICSETLENYYTFRFRTQNIRYASAHQPSHRIAFVTCTKYLSNFIKPNLRPLLQAPLELMIAFQIQPAPEVTKYSDPY
jgi:hypothetical protein